MSESKTGESLYLYDHTATPVPELGLGDYVKGFSNQNARFLWALLPFVIVPILGQIGLIVYLIYYFTKKKKSQKMLLYSNGFFYGTNPNDRPITEADGTKVSFDDVRGIMRIKTRHLTNGIYSSTTETVHWLDNDLHEHQILDGGYKNEYETELEGFDYVGYITRSLLPLWHKVAVEKHHAEWQQNHYTTFYFRNPVGSFGKEELMPVQISAKSLKVGNRSIEADTPFRYQYQRGWLFINPSKESGKQPMGIQVSKMYDYSVFKHLAHHYFGIEDH